MASYSEYISPALRGGHSVRSSHGYTSLTTAPTCPGDMGITVSTDGAVSLSPAQIREIANDWLARADLIDEEGRAR